MDKKDIEKDFASVVHSLERHMKFMTFVQTFISWLHHPPKFILKIGTIIVCLVITMPLISIWTENWIWAKIFATIVLSGFIIVSLFTEWAKIDSPEESAKPNANSYAIIIGNRVFKFKDLRCRQCNHTDSWQNFSFGFSDVHVPNEAPSRLMVSMCPKCGCRVLDPVGDDKEELVIVASNNTKPRTVSIPKKSPSQKDLFESEIGKEDAENERDYHNSQNQEE